MDVMGAYGAIASAGLTAASSIGVNLLKDKNEYNQRVADAKNAEIESQFNEREAYKKTLASLGEKYGDNSLAGITVPKNTFTYDAIKPKSIVDTDALQKSIMGLGSMLAQASIGAIPKKEDKVTTTKGQDVVTDPNAKSSTEATGQVKSEEVTTPSGKKGCKLKPRFNTKSFKKCK